MPVLANQVVTRQGRDGGIRYVAVAAATRIFEGTLVFLDANGNATDVKADANTVFAGVARCEANNSSGPAGARQVEFWTDGEFELPGSALTPADLNAEIYGVDNYTTTKSPTGNPAIGRLVAIKSETLGVVSIAGLGRDRQATP